MKNRWPEQLKHESYRYGIWLDTAPLAKSNCVVVILRGLVVMFRGKMGTKYMKIQFQYAYSNQS